MYKISSTDVKIHKIRTTTTSKTKGTITLRYVPREPVREEIPTNLWDSDFFYFLRTNMILKCIIDRMEAVMCTRNCCDRDIDPFKEFENRQLEEYEKFCEEFYKDLLERSLNEPLRRLKHKKNPIPTTEENQKKRLNDNLRGVFG